MADKLSADDEITIIDRTGKVMVNRLPKRFKPKETGDKAARISNMMIHEINRSLTEFNFATLDTIMLQGIKGKVCILPTRENDDFYITLVGKIG